MHGLLVLKLPQRQPCLHQSGAKSWSRASVFSALMFAALRIASHPRVLHVIGLMGSLQNQYVTANGPSEAEIEIDDDAGEDPGVAMHSATNTATPSDESTAHTHAPPVFFEGEALATYEMPSSAFSLSDSVYGAPEPRSNTDASRHTYVNDEPAIRVGTQTLYENDSDDDVPVPRTKTHTLLSVQSELMYLDADGALNDEQPYDYDNSIW